MCHCLACQKRTGSAFGIQARWPADRVTFEGVATEFKRTGDEGTTATFRFCPTCGAIVYWTADALPGLVYLPIGAFADPTFPPPQIAVYCERRHPWAVMPNLHAEEFD